MELHQIISNNKTVSVPKTDRTAPDGLFSEILRKKVESPDITGASVNSKDTASVAIGTITRDMPTVSHLLVKHPQYQKDCWRIIHAKINQNKPFTRIGSGETIYIDPATHEITWGKKQVTKQSLVAENQNQNFDKTDEALSARLINAVKPYIGTSYKKIDCYELVVNGIKSLGYKYHGQEGIKNSLIKMAVHDRLPANAYLTGEGLTEKTGKTVVSKSYGDIENPVQSARKFIHEIKPLFKEGRILSFSTLTKGHTGIISKLENQWTFINSGRMDNSVGENVNTNEVGEEFLTDEIENWFALAKKHKEPLKITIGALDKKKLAMFM
ncbi:MAG: hypothetical protein KOO64_10025 [Desulfobacterales bacterium]|nr:hypothetical protein [Desulfobacterales bacterium]